jgi:hypothetical protein
LLIAFSLVTSLLVIFNEIDNMKNFHHVISLSSIFLLLSS